MPHGLQGKRAPSAGSARTRGRWLCTNEPFIDNVVKFTPCGDQVTAGYRLIEVPGARLVNAEGDNNVAAECYQVLSF